MMGSKRAILFAVCLLSVRFVNAQEIQMSDVYAVDNQTLSELRGGFQLANDYVVDIGISISASVNGENIYRSTIANLVFRNGTLTAESISGDSLPNSNLVSVVQVGDGNVVEGVDSQTERPHLPKQGGIDTSIINIIQNTLDNSVLGVSTVVDVDARVDSVNKQIRDDLRLKDALLNHNF